MDYLDLSSNSLFEFDIVLNTLRYLNLENNRIESINKVLLDFFSIEIVNLANNRLQQYPYFDKSQLNLGIDESLLEIHLNDNQINQIEYFSFMFDELKLANFDSNKISFISIDAFLNCRNLEILHLGNNRLTNLTENMFHFLFSLIHLNLSSNEISFIEKKSFGNLTL